MTVKARDSKHREGSTPVETFPVRPVPLNEDEFRNRLALERKRSERSDMLFILMLAEIDDEPAGRPPALELDRAISNLTSVTRETDAVGWSTSERCLGAIFTGILPENREAALSAIKARAGALLQIGAGSPQHQPLRLSFYVFPDDWTQGCAFTADYGPLYSDLKPSSEIRKGMLTIKRILDVVGAISLLFITAPLFLLIGTAIKVTSPGPVFFRQERVGQFGQRFIFFKFRSMGVDNDHTSHQEYVKQLISGTAKPMLVTSNGQPVYKLANDDRITRLGGLLRKTSLDELPQFVNVLRGEMSLVGPSPPIPYELNDYRVWHRRRLLQVKPGITGLWQVNGRSRVAFDEMARLDLQ